MDRAYPPSPAHPEDTLLPDPENHLHPDTENPPRSAHCGLASAKRFAVCLSMVLYSVEFVFGVIPHFSWFNSLSQGSKSALGFGGVSGFTKIFMEGGIHFWLLLCEAFFLFHCMYVSWILNIM